MPRLSPPLIFDLHLDLAMNALEWNRDLREPVERIRSREQGLSDKVDRGRNTVSFPSMREGRVGLCVATQIAGCPQRECPVPGWRSPEQAYAQTQGQLAWYRAMEEAGALRQIASRADLEACAAAWSSEASAPAPIGYVLSLEGADSIRSAGHLEHAYQDGLRALGPAHYGPGRYAAGTGALGGFPAQGEDLLKEMSRLGLILDVTHLSDLCLRRALDIYPGPIWASHSNARALAPGQRQLSDGQIKELASRGAVIGAALDAWMMIPNWKRGETTPETADVTLSVLVDHIEHICNLLGNADHCALGTDLDGGFGTEQTPRDLDTIADLQSIPSLLMKRGFSDDDVAKICHGNALAFLSRHLPA